MASSPRDVPGRGLADDSLNRLGRGMVGIAWHSWDSGCLGKGERGGGAGLERQVELEVEHG